MLQVADRPQWRVVQRRLIELHRRPAERPGTCRCAWHRRCARFDATASPWSLRATTAKNSFDQVVLACHSDQALALLADASAGRTHRSSAPSATRTTTPCCTPTRACCPRRRTAWAAWNAHIPRTRGSQLHRQLLHEPAAVAGIAGALHRYAQPHRGHRSGQDHCPHALPASRLHPCQRGRAGAQATRSMALAAPGLPAPTGVSASTRTACAAASRWRARWEWPGDAVDGTAPSTRAGCSTAGRRRASTHSATACSMLYLDLDELPGLFAKRWLWSLDRPQPRPGPPQRLFRRSGHSARHGGSRSRAGRDRAFAPPARSACSPMAAISA